MKRMFKMLLIIFLPFLIFHDLFNIFFMVHRDPEKYEKTPRFIRWVRS